METSDPRTLAAGSEAPLAVGIDLVEIERIAAAFQRHGERFLNRHFTPREQAWCAGDPASLAARWAAKEATAKALGTGIGPIRWREVEIIALETGQPVLLLHGSAAQIAAQRGLDHWTVSLTHCRCHAAAVVIGTGPSAAGRGP